MTDEDHSNNSNSITALTSLSIVFHVVCVLTSLSPMLLFHYLGAIFMAITLLTINDIYKMNYSGSYIFVIFTVCILTLTKSQILFFIYSCIISIIFCIGIL